MENAQKIVEFHYCTTCKHYKEDQDCDICHECLNNPTNTYSHKPVNYEEANNAGNS